MKYSEISIVIPTPPPGTIPDGDYVTISRPKNRQTIQIVLGGNKKVSMNKLLSVENLSLSDLFEKLKITGSDADQAFAIIRKRKGKKNGY